MKQVVWTFFTILVTSIWWAFGKWHNGPPELLTPLVLGAISGTVIWCIFVGIFCMEYWEIK